MLRKPVEVGGWTSLVMTTPLGRPVALVARDALGLRLDLGPTGSSDTLFDWFTLALWLALAVVAGLIALAVPRKLRRDPPTSSSISRVCSSG